MEEEKTPTGGAHTVPSQGNYQSLYRKYRPQRFSEIKGQDHVVKALRNSLQEGRTTHAYLFSGPRGTGKTSTARILAKALNCTDLQDGEPCGKCESCVAITEQSSFDVHELDAASSGRVEDIRELVARASLTTPGRYKVYIIDEVHMLSTAASNALLKTLEEPPSHVVFVLATTDPQKVLSTIRSRTQHYEFHLLPDAVLDSLLNEVVTKEGINIAEPALEQVRKSGKGSARDALSVLDRVAAGGSPDDDFAECINEVISAMAAYDPSSVLAALKKAFAIGIDPKVATSLIVDELRELLLGNFQIGTSRKDKVKENTLLIDVDRSFSNARLVNAIEELGSAQVKMRDALDPRIILEITLLRLSASQTDSSPESLLRRISSLESELAHIKSFLRETGLDRQDRNSLLPPKIEKESSMGKSTLGLEKPALGADLKNSKDDAVSLATPASSDSFGETTAVRGSRELNADSQSLAKGKLRENSRPEVFQSLPIESAAGITASETTRSDPLQNWQGDGPALRDQLAEIWGDKVLKRLRLKARAIYIGGHFILGSDNLPLFVFMNEATLNHAKPLRAEVEQIISEELGYKFTLNLGVEKHENYLRRQETNPPADRTRDSENKNTERTTDFSSAKPGNTSGDKTRHTGLSASKQSPSKSPSVSQESSISKPKEDIVMIKAPYSDVGYNHLENSVTALRDDIEEEFELMPTEDTMTPVTLAVEHVLKVFPGAKEVSGNV